MQLSMSAPCLHVGLAAKAVRSCNSTERELSLCPASTPGQSSKSCGDLIFSSHITFLLVFMWTYAVMGQYIVLKVGGTYKPWVCGGLGASRVHGAGG